MTSAITTAILAQTLTTRPDDALAMVLGRYPYLVAKGGGPLFDPGAGALEWDGQAGHLAVVGQIATAAGAAVDAALTCPGPIPAGLASWRRCPTNDVLETALVLFATSGDGADTVSSQIAHLTTNAVSTLFEWYPDVLECPSDALAVTITAFRAALRQLVTGRAVRTLVLYHYIAEQVLVSDRHPHHAVTVNGDGVSLLDPTGADGMFDLVGGVLESGSATRSGPSSSETHQARNARPITRPQAGPR